MHGLCLPSGRLCSCQSEENIEAIKELYEDEPDMSIRKAASETGIDKEGVRRILKFDLKIKPYKVPRVQPLKEEDLGKRVEACQALLDLLDDKPDALEDIMMTDESIFTLDNTISPQNKRHWSKTRPSRVQQQPLQPSRVHVWCEMTQSFVVGPYFFDESVTSESYIEMLETFLYPELQRRRLIRRVIFQQDGAPAHTSANAIEWLNRKFRERVISRRCQLAWPARSPDLTPPDFCLWGNIVPQT